jgi:hypothetical protein
MRVRIFFFCRAKCKFFQQFYRLIARIPKASKDCLKENLLDIHFDTHDTTDTFVKKKLYLIKKLNLYTEVL